MNKPLALVIEDDIDLSEIFSMALRSGGFETEAFNDGKAALNAGRYASRGHYAGHAFASCNRGHDPAHHTGGRALCQNRCDRRNRGCTTGRRAAGPGGFDLAKTHQR